MAICRGIIEAHGGRIWASQRPTGGTLFSFTFPLDGQPPGDGHGVDTAADGSGTVKEQRLYQLIRLKNPGEHVFTIEFADPGVQAFAFTFG